MGTAEQDAPRGNPRGRTTLLAVTAVVLFALVIGRWMVSPFDDWVPLVAPAPADVPADVNPEDLPVSAQFRCSAAFGETESASPSAQATEALALQELSREPCSEIRTQHRLVGPLNLVLAAGSLVVLVVAARRRTGRAPSATGSTTAA